MVLQNTKSVNRRTRICKENGQNCKEILLEDERKNRYNKRQQQERGKSVKLGNSLYSARKKKGMSQEMVAEKLGVSRQTISKWETDETLPDIRQAKQLSSLYGLSLDELIDFDLDLQEIQDTIDRISDEVTEKIDWTKAWSRKYPILATYQKEVDITYYAGELQKLLIRMEKEYGYDELNSMLVLKDILATVWKNRKGKKKK